MSADQPIVKFLKRNQFHIGMFFWVKAIVINLSPSVSIKSAIELFIRHNGFLGDKEPSIDALVNEYHRMNNEYIEMQKS